MAETRPRVAVGGATRGRAGGNQREYQPTGTMTLTEALPERPVLRLDLAARRVRWSADTHDNEHDGGRTSKSCCIYHRPRRFDESSSESSADDSDGSSSSGSSCGDSEGDGAGCSEGDGAGCSRDGGARRARSRWQRRRPRPADGGGGGPEKDDGSSSSDGGQIRRPVRREVPPDDVNTFATGGD